MGGVTLIVSGAHEHEISVRIAIVGDEAQLRLNIRNSPRPDVLVDNETQNRAAENVGIHKAAIKRTRAATSVQKNQKLLQNRLCTETNLDLCIRNG